MRRRTPSQDNSAKARAAKKLPAGSKRQMVSLIPETLEIAERIGKDIPGNLNMGTSAITKGINQMAKVLVKLEVIATAYDMNLEELINLLPHAALAGIRDWTALPLEGEIIAYLSERADAGDERAEELLESAQVHSAELVMSRHRGGEQVGDAYIL